jgi:DNA repair ATPase RecN
MRLDELTVGSFKNLRDFHVDFDESSPYTVLVGGNGAGKSNLIEALALIFRHLDLNVPAPFDYHLRLPARDRLWRSGLRAHGGGLARSSTRQSGRSRRGTRCLRVRTPVRASEGLRIGHNRSRSTRLMLS